MLKNQEQINQELKERLKHRDVLLDIQAVLGTKSGRSFVKYLFECFDVGELPPVGFSGDLLMDRLGFLRAGNSIFKIIAEANSEVAGSLLGQIEKEKYDQIQYDQTRQGD